MARQSTKPSWEALQAELADPDYKVRKEAIKRIMRHYRQRAYEPLLVLLEDGRGEVRAGAVQALGKLKDARAFLPVLGLLTDKHARVRAQVAWALGEFGDRSVVSTLVDLLNDPRSQIRAYAARSLSKLRDLSTLSRLFAYLEQTRKTGDEIELYHAARAVGDFGVPSVIEPLLSLREYSPSRSVLWIVVDVLSRQGEHTLPVLLETLADQTRPEGVRTCIVDVLARKPRPELLEVLMTAQNGDLALLSQSAIRALGTLKDPRVIEILSRLLDDKQNDLISSEAVNVLVSLKATSALECIRRLLAPEILAHASTWLVQTVVKALGELGDQQAVMPLLDVLWQADRFACQNEVVQALCAINDPTIVRLLLQGLATYHPRVRWCVVDLLAYFRDRSAVEPLLALLEMPAVEIAEKNVQDHVIRALGVLRDPRALEPLLALLDVRVTDRAEINRQKQLITVLGLLGDPRAIEPLQASLPQATDKLHTTIWSALNELGANEAYSRPAN